MDKAEVAQDGHKSGHSYEKVSLMLRDICGAGGGI